MTSAIRALLTALIDYAGLFPPASLSMQETLSNYASYRKGEFGWALGRLIVPCARLEEFADCASTLVEGGAPWTLSALGGESLESDMERVSEFNRRNAALAIIDTIEFRAQTATEIKRVSRWMPPGVTVYVETPGTNELLDAVSAAGLRAKIRTGGVTRDAFPEASTIVGFIGECAKRDLAFKATAGLHHPLRCFHPLTYEPEAPSGTMHGFLNVFTAACFIRAGADSGVGEGILAEEEASAFQFGDDGIQWRGLQISVDGIRHTRETLAISFGSCSFEEPIGDLVKLGAIDAGLISGTRS